MLVPGKAAVAYYYLVGSYTLGRVAKNDYRTRVSQVLVTEKGKWKIKSGHFSPLHSGSEVRLGSCVFNRISVLNKLCI